LDSRKVRVSAICRPFDTVPGFSSQTKSEIAISESKSPESRENRVSKNERKDAYGG
jgi:hypothetical protein